MLGFNVAGIISLPSNKLELQRETLLVLVNSQIAVKLQLGEALSISAYDSKAEM